MYYPKGKAVHKMEIKFNVEGDRRKKLAEAVAIITGNKPVYQGLPTYAYKIGELVIGKTGNLIIPDGADHDLTDHLMTLLLNMGFTIEQADSLTIELPKEGFTEIALTNLQQLIKSKESLIKKALGVESLSIEQTEQTLRFPWFSGSLTPDEIHAYSRFIGAVYALAKNLKHVSAKEKAVDNERYAFRCFLLRLGFIGDYKAERKILLSRLSGSTAFKSGKRKPEEIAAE
jgi:hypothetical protein